MRITVYDGATTIGGNKIYLEEEGKGIFLDFGMNFARHRLYYDEFLRERSSRGIYDAIQLGMIPRLNVYRKDLIPSDLDVSGFPKPDVLAVLLSHAHLDHCGCIGYLDAEIPIAATATTLAILKAMRDTSKPGPGMEIPYFSKRVPADDSRVLEASRSAKDPYCCRRFYCTEEMDERLRQFFCESHRSKRIEPPECGKIDELGIPFGIEACELDHSVYGACGFLIQGDTTVAYTGDFRVHGRSAEKTERFLRKARDASVLVIEGTKAGDEGSVSEREVFMNCLKAVENARGLVIADFSPRNFERLEMFGEIARRTGRELAVTAKDAYTLKALECADGIDRMKDCRVYFELKAQRDAWENQVLELYSEKRVDPAEIRKNSECFILCFSYYDMKHLLDIRPESGTYIYSSSEAYSEEQDFDFLRLNSWLRLFSFEIRGFRIDQNGLHFERGYHASGHASSEDLRRAIETADPEIIIPVHTEKAEWFLEQFGERVKKVSDGGSVEI